MKKTSKPIVFFGSGPVAAASLELLARDFAVEAVITKPRPAHHKQPFPVLAVAEKLKLKTLVAGTSEEVSELFKAGSFSSELGIIIDHGIILAPDVINHFRFGIVNSHFSLMPRWRGADPISFAILSGDKETGVSLMVIAEKLDEGQLIAQQALPIGADVTGPELTKQLIALSHELLVKTLPAYVDGQVGPYPQPGVKPTYSRKLTKHDGHIDWREPAGVIERQIRAFAGWPKSRATLGETAVIINQAAVVSDQQTFKDSRSLKPGEVRVSGKRLLIGTGEGPLEILKLTPAGRREMTAEAFLAGYNPL